MGLEGPEDSSKQRLAPAVNALLGLPWELLKDPERPTPLALDPDFAAIDRTFEAQGAATEIPPGENLRVLMVIARPAGIEDVGYQMIARPLLERLQAARLPVELEVLRPPTVDALEDKLKQAVRNKQFYHVLHFDGHGIVHHRADGGLTRGPSSHDRAIVSRGTVMWSSRRQRAATIRLPAKTSLV
jgi:hypothetical protein